MNDSDLWQTPNKKLLIVAHAPSDNTRVLVDAVVAGAQHPDIKGVEVCYRPPLEAAVEDVMVADGIILGTTENLAYMSGLLKDFFDRIYYPCLEAKQGMPVMVFIRAGHDGTGTKKALETILTGLKWKWVQEPLICRGDWQESFVQDCEELGMYMAASLEAGIV